GCWYHSLVARERDLAGIMQALDEELARRAGDAHADALRHSIREGHRAWVLDRDWTCDAEGGLLLGGRGAYQAALRCAAELTLERSERMLLALNRVRDAE